MTNFNSINKKACEKEIEEEKEFLLSLQPSTSTASSMPICSNNTEKIIVQN